MCTKSNNNNYYYNNNKQQQQPINNTGHKFAMSKYVTRKHSEYKSPCMQISAVI